jgi:hypothetical protein
MTKKISFTVRVCDGNGRDEWYFHIKDPAVGLDHPRVSHDITPEQHQAMEEALAKALELVRSTPPRGPATVTRLPVKEGA